MFDRHTGRHFDRYDPVRGDPLKGRFAPFAIRASVAFGLAFVGFGLGPATAAPPPRLSFTAAEIGFAEAIAGDPGLAAFYGARDLRPVFTGPAARERRRALLAAIETAPEHGLPAGRYQPARLRGLLDAADGQGDELAMARIFSTWVHDVSAGILDPRKVDPAIKRVAQGVDVGAVLHDFATGDPARALARAEPADPRYRILKDALARERRLEAPADMALVPAGVLKAGSHGPAVAALRARLAAMGFAAPAPDETPGEAPDAAPDEARFDDGLATAVEAFQAAAGLQADGIAGPATIARVNAPPGTGARDILIAMERLRWLPDDLDEGGHRHVWVNLPQYEAEVFADGSRVFETRVVVGKTDADLQTPEFSDRLRHIVANPSWNVPRSITVKEYLPKLKANANAVAHLDVIDGRGNVVPRGQIDFSRYTAANFPYRMREKPSAGNALGQVKFLFPNRWNIYLHDTPSKWLFDQSRRAASHGCVRVGRPLDLARLLLEGQVADPAATLDAALQGGNERWLNIRPGVPIHLVYFTTLPDADGRMHRFPDIYGRDGKVWAALQAAFDAAPGARQLARR